MFNTISSAIYILDQLSAVHTVFIDVSVYIIVVFFFNLFIKKVDIVRGVRQKDSTSRKLFTVSMKIVSQKPKLTGGIDTQGEVLKDLRFTEDIALCTDEEESISKQLNQLNTESKKIGLKIHKGKTKFMSNF